MAKKVKKVTISFCTADIKGESLEYLLGNTPKAIRDLFVAVEQKFIEYSDLKVTVE